MYHKPLIFALSLVWGGGLFGYALNVQDEQRALEQASLEPSPEAVRVMPPPPTAKVSEPAPVVVEPAALDIPPVVIRAPLRVKPRAPVVKPVVLMTRPCSTWRELGPQHVNSGNPSGMHEVRELCE
jgi:hypothetical protein